MHSDSAPIRVPDDATCLTCGYALRELPTRNCPECGRVFDPNNPLTYRRPGDAWWHRWARPPRVQAYAISLMAVLILLGTSNPGGFIWITLWVCTMGGPVGGVILVILYLVHVGAVRHARSLGLDLERTRCAWFGWIATPIAVTLITSAFLWDWPMRVRFAVSRAAFTLAAEEHSSGRGRTGIQIVGLYVVDRIDVENRGVYFRTGSDMLDPAGFVYSPGNCGPASQNFVAQDWCLYSD